MKIIVPMAGNAAEFEKEFGTVKPLVKIRGRTMVELICSMFPRDSRFIFLCRRDVLDKNDPRSTLKNIPYGFIELTPVDRQTKNVLETLMFANRFVDNDEEILIAHCDSYSKFDYSKFVAHIKSEGADGALTAFTGFNPCDIKSCDYGRIGIKGRCVTGIFEKRPIEAGQFTATGCYYFSSWKLFKKYAYNMLEDNQKKGGPIFVSEVYNKMLKDGKRIVHYLVDSFVNYRTPKDVKEFIYWAEVFSKINDVQMKGDNHYEYNASRNS